MTTGALPGGPLELLFERPDLPLFDLPEPLEAAYGGPFGLREDCVYANFVTTPAGEARLKGRVPPTTRFESGPIRLPEVIERLRAQGHRRILTEGGPTLASELAAAELLDELFLTRSPTLFGRLTADGR